MRTLSPPVLAGLVGGALFFAHALVNNSHAWPLVWPLAAGIMAVALSAKRHALGGFWDGLGQAVKAGLIAGLLFFVATVVALMLLATPPLQSVASALGAGPHLVTSGVITTLAAVGAGGMLLATLAGAITFPMVRDRG